MRKGQFHGFGSIAPMGDPDIGPQQPHRSEQFPVAVECQSEAMRSGFGACFDVLPVYRDLRQLQKGKFRATLNLKQGRIRGVAAGVASTLR